MQKRDRLFRSSGVAIVAAVGLRAAYSVLYEEGPFALNGRPAWAFAFAFVVFAVAYALAPQDAETKATPRRLALIAIQSLTALAMVLLYPIFITVSLLVVVVWQVALVGGLRMALIVTAAQSVILTAFKCAGQSAGMTWIILVTSFGFQMFAIGAAQLLRNEMGARLELARANAELKAAQALLSETVALGERLRISRDLHDVLGHSLTTLTIQLDVATRLAEGPERAHLATARQIAAELLDQVRSVVSRFRDQPIDLRPALTALAENTGNLNVRLVIPDDLCNVDSARADAIVRCVQELVTNTLRHADARELVIELRQSGDDIVVSAADDGHGGDILEGRGLTGMRERFEALGGAISITSRLGEGVRVLARMPLAESSR